MKDLRDRSDIEMLIQIFYEKVKADSLIGPHFGHVNWTKHLPVMYDFWESVLFFTGNYSGNPMQAHNQLHQRMPMLPEHFARWKEIFISTVDQLFSGEKAELAKSRAYSIAYIMEQKITGKPQA